jgi:hypothetical protein
MVTTLTGWFTVSAGGEPLEWYWLLSAALMLGLISTIGEEPIPGLSREASHVVTPDQPLAPNLAHPIPRMARAMLVAAVWGGLTYLFGLDLIVILVVAAVVGVGFAFRRPREGGTAE